MSDCGVCIGGGDVDGYIEMMEQGVIKSRKDRACCECRRPIPKGSQCERTSGKWEGYFFADHTCLDCMNIRIGLSCEEPTAIGELWREVSDCQVFERLTTACLAKIETASARAYLLERWRRWKGLDPETDRATAC